MMAKKKKYLIGDRYINNDGFWFEVVGYVEGKYSRRIVKFDSGYISNVHTSNIASKEVKDYLSPCVFGVGIIGAKGLRYHFLYTRWKSMIGRCYDKNAHGYKSYGAKGVTIDSELLDFRNYISVIENMEGYENLRDSPSEYEIDKDIIGNGCKIYSRDTISIVSKCDNNRYYKESVKNVMVKQIDLDGNVIEVFSSMSKASRVTGVCVSSIQKVVRGERNKAGGYIWRSVSGGM